MYLSSLDNEEFLHILLGKRLAVIEDEFEDKTAYFTFDRICATYIYTAVDVYYSA